MPIYLACGLLIDSELRLPLAQAPALCASVDIRVLRGSVPLPFHGNSGCGNWEVNHNQVLFQVSGIVRFRISAGCEIRFELEGTGKDADAIPFLLSTAFAALLHQRELLALHAGAISLNGQAVALCGPAGVGKSTLITTLCAAGCGLLSDDLSVIQPGADARPWLLPDGRHHQLWADSIEQLHLTDRQGSPIREGLRKFQVAPASTSSPDPMPLRIIVMLHDPGQPARTTIYPLQPVDAIAALMNNIYCRPLAAHLGCNAQLFKAIAATLAQVQVLCLERHPRFQQLDDDSRLLLEHIQ